MKVTTQPTQTNSFVSEYWSAESGASAVAYLRKQLAAALAYMRSPYKNKGV